MCCKVLFRFLAPLIALFLLAIMVSSGLATMVVCARNLKEEQEGEDKEPPSDQTPPAYILKMEVLEVQTPPICFRFSAKFHSDNVEPIQFTLCKDKS